MFGFQKRINKNQIIEDLRAEIQFLGRQKELDDRDLAHLLKMKEEKIALELKTKELDLAKEYQARASELQSKYVQNLVEEAAKDRQTIERLYTEVLRRLPNINVEVKRRK